MDGWMKGEEMDKDYRIMLESSCSTTLLSMKMVSQDTSQCMTVVYNLVWSHKKKQTVMQNVMSIMSSFSIAC